MDPPPPATPTTAAPAPALLRRLSAVDASLSRLLHRHNFLPRPLFLLLELSADFRLFFPVSLSLYLSPIPSLRPLLAPLILGLLLDLALVGLVKLLFRRPRPVYNKNMSVAVSVDHYSFPSGHASRVFFVAALVYLSADAMEGAVVESRSGGFVDRWIADGSERKFVELVVLVASAWAAATANSRVLLGRHYVCDVLAGACLGVIEGWLAHRYLRL
ncbi:probable lipid phosphate phosphatase beta [Syzygium oleosum]|uniref:probable lipid phosphate phosphatase beta n=1 Tax=Syzygium oleosum TaxID=219896 RepID=UPI0011D1DB10|nr:probable lipid phosphate phosphatase beta [Syzygium oleosum]XP_030469421.1 probable lipid phosphate phosphatase beta [Syzygium oleosum]XP_056174364.1 probable lipid phosphate phosphatase beta [Syzygium oleosum]